MFVSKYGSCLYTTQITGRQMNLIRAHDKLLLTDYTGPSATAGYLSCDVEYFRQIMAEVLMNFFFLFHRKINRDPKKRWFWREGSFDTSFLNLILFFILYRVSFLHSDDTFKQQRLISKCSCIARRFHIHNFIM